MKWVINYVDIVRKTEASERRTAKKLEKLLSEGWEPYHIEHMPFTGSSRYHLKKQENHST